MFTLALPFVGTALFERCHTVRRWTCLPTCVGIDPTRTSAKLVNHVAKSIPELGGVFDLSDEAELAAWMVEISVGEYPRRVRRKDLMRRVLGSVVT